MLFGIENGSRFDAFETMKYLIIEIYSRAPRGRVD